MITVPVALGERSYDVHVGRGAAELLAEVLPARARRAAVVTQAAVPLEVAPGVDAERFLIGAGEEHKSLATIEQLCSGFARWGLTRDDVVVAVGGGMVTDVAGFAAASYHRGVAVVHVATTLLAQVDAAIGGKTGVNLAEGKNLVGAFWQPSAVLCDTAALDTLPPEERRSGLGEVAKYHFLGGDDLEGRPLDEQVARCVEIKAAVVAEDEREGGRRAVLNYGHTLAHALETSGRYGLRHGEAVSVGLLYAAEVARLLGRIDAARVDDHRRVLGALDLPSSVVVDDPDAVLDLMARDKKALTGPTMVLDGPRGVEVVPDIEPSVLRAALDVVRR